MTLLSKGKKLNSSYVTISRSTLETPLGQMIAVANERSLLMLAFADQLYLEGEVERLVEKASATITQETNAVLGSIGRELALYFKGQLKEFKTPYVLVGTPFQISVWRQLIDIPYGQTRSYGDIASALDNPLASRAVGSANGSNKLPLIVPCHRVINTGGKLGGYACGLSRKKWLLELEKTAV